MRVVATSGHVDHGKSTLVKALTGMEPDRWQAERDRGLTIDLGFAWTRLPSGETLALVDVPGHERFIGNMVAGIGGAPAVMFIVAADEGWSAQSQEHLAALHALDVRHGLVVITKIDLADPAEATAQTLRQLAGTSLQGLPIVPVSARTGSGIDRLRTELDVLVSSLPAPESDRVRLWVDRSFTIRGAGTVVTGTLAEGTVEIGDELLLGDRRVRVRSLQSLEQPRQRVRAPARVALNLADVSVRDVGRGDVLLGARAAAATDRHGADRHVADRQAPAQWPITGTVDARFTPAPVVAATNRAVAERVVTVDDLPRQLMLHVGTAAVQVALRPLSGDAVRVSLPRALPLAVGDRAILRNPGTHHIVGGLLVVDADPPPLRRRGEGRRRGEELATATGTIDVGAEVARRGIVPLTDVARWGVQLDPDAAIEGVLRLGDHLVDEASWDELASRLAEAVDAQSRRDPLQPTLSAGAAQAAVGLDIRALLPMLVQRAGLRLDGGRVGRPGLVADLGPAEPGLRDLEARLRDDPLAAPERDELVAAGLGPRELAAAAQAGRILRLSGDIMLLPDAPARAMRILAGVEQPFTLSQARQALGSTRRVVVPLLEYLDSRGWTRRVDGAHRQVVR